MRVSSVGVALLASIAPTTLAQDQPNQPCVSGLHMIVARASDEPPGVGIIGIVARMVKRQIPNSSIVAVKYPATLDHYFSSEGKGVVGMNELVKQYVDNCPNAMVALFGYSQGAQVVGDVLCGTSEPGFKKSPPLAQNYSDQIVAAIQMGDPSFIEGLPYDVGTSTKNGTFERLDTKACLPYTSRLRSYCDRNDLFCASGSSLAVHIGYTQVYGKQAANFVVQRYNSSLSAAASTGAGKSPGNSSSGGGNSGSSGRRTGEAVLKSIFLSAVVAMGLL